MRPAIALDGWANVSVIGDWEGSERCLLNDRDLLLREVVQLVHQTFERVAPWISSFPIAQDHPTDHRLSITSIHTAHVYAIGL